MEGSNHRNNNNGEGNIALGTPPLPPTGERMTGESSQDPNLDPRKLQRMLANRRYAKTHHFRQNCRISKLEWTVRCLQGDIERYSAHIYYTKRQGDMFRVENSELKQKLSFYSHAIESKKAEYVKLKKEKGELKEVYAEQLQEYGEIMRSDMAYAPFMGMDQSGRPT